MVLAMLSSWHSVSFPWEALLLAAAVVAADRAAAAFRAFGRDDRQARGYALLLGVGLSAFAAVLVLFLSLEQGWPLLLLGVGVAAALAFGRSVPPAPWGELLAAAVPGVVLWLATAYLFEPQSRWTPDFWWRTALLSLPSALFLASLATVYRSCERGRAGHGVLLFPLAAYAALGVLAGLQVLPWTFFLALVAGPALSAPLWRSMFRRGFDGGFGAVIPAVSALLVYTLVSAGAWVTEKVLP